MSASGFLAMIRELSKLPQAEFKLRIGFYGASREAFDLKRRLRIAASGSDRRILADEWPTEKHWSKEEWPHKEA